jgi:hypothetical protein
MVSKENYFDGDSRYMAIISSFKMIIFKITYPMQYYKMGALIVDKYTTIL